MGSRRSKKAPIYRLSLLAALLAAAGCSSFPASDSPDSQASLTVEKGKKLVKQAVSENSGSGDTPVSSNAAVSGDAAIADTKSDDTGDQLLEASEYTDLWARVRAGYGLPVLDTPLVERHEKWFANNPEYVENMVNRARLYLFYIVEEVEKRGMPMEIALLPAIESAYKPHAYSRARAAGLWQFIKSTGRIYGLEMNWWYDGRRDVMASTQAALDYLEKLHGQFGDWQLALAAYNCGERKVERLVAENKRKGLPTDYSSLRKLPRETKNYVPRLMAMAHIIADPAKYGFQLAAIPNTEYFARIETEGQIDLGVVARLSDMPVDDLFMINPGYQRWITDPNGPHALLVPADKKEALLEGLSKLSDEDRVQWARHEVRRGDTMSRVAGHYGVTVEAIRSANNMRSNHLSAGQNLLIPVSANKVAAVPPPTYVSKSARAASRSRENGGGSRVKIVHRVRSGETLWSIARRYKVYIHQIREWNLLETEDTLRLGQRLFIWTTRGSDASASSGMQHPG
jgi:membrane-bound lytic murein transglycosylase D